MKTIATYTLQIVDDQDSIPNGHAPPDRVKRACADLPAVIEETQENITDLLPVGFSAQIREWDARPDVVMEIEVYDDRREDG